MECAPSINLFLHVKRIFLVLSAIFLRFSSRQRKQNVVSAKLSSLWSSSQLIISLNMIYFIPHEFLFLVVYIPGSVDMAVREKNINIRLQTLSQFSCYSSRGTIGWHKLSIRKVENLRGPMVKKKTFFFSVSSQSGTR